MFWSGLLIALALSIDGFVAGVMYGMRRIVVPWGSLAVLGGCTALSMSLSMYFGNVLSTGVSLHGAHTMGAVILVLIGLWQLGQGWAEYMRRQVPAGPDGKQSLARFRLARLGIVVHILADPIQADCDASGSIDLKEALALGIALGLDTLGAGFAAAMLGFGYWLIGVVTLSLVILVRAGSLSGRYIGKRLLNRKGMLLPGMLLILMGLLQLR